MGFVFKGHFEISFQRPPHPVTAVALNSTALTHPAPCMVVGTQHGTDPRRQRTPARFQSPLTSFTWVRAVNVSEPHSLVSKTEIRMTGERVAITTT